jgi:polysaccharide deacetylase family protein (PEP-CTERM system associated)
VRNAFTVDVEDYYHVTAFDKLIDRSCWDAQESRIVASTERVLQVLESAGVRGTFFILGWVADHHPDLVRTIHTAGHEIGCHSYWHRLVYEQTPDEFRSDLRQARSVLEDIIGEPVVAYRAPCFSITRHSLWALDILIEEGFQFDSSIFPTFHDRYGLAGGPLAPHRIKRPGGMLREFPLPVYSGFGYPLPIGGGGYLRLYPYFCTGLGLRAINATSRPFTAYVHPWELDPQQPRQPSGRLKAFRHYVNLHRTEGRLTRLLRDFTFGTLSEVVGQLDEHNALPTWDLTQVS